MIQHFCEQSLGSSLYAGCNNVYWGNVLFACQEICIKQMLSELSKSVEITQES
jgi:hypothetical protein